VLSDRATHTCAQANHATHACVPPRSPEQTRRWQPAAVAVSWHIPCDQTRCFNVEHPHQRLSKLRSNSSNHDRTQVTIKTTSQLVDGHRIWQCARGKDLPPRGRREKPIGSQC
jgi:hypothetical protein